MKWNYPSVDTLQAENYAMLEAQYLYVENEFLGTRDLDAKGCVELENIYVSRFGKPLKATGPHKLRCNAFDTGFKSLQSSTIS